MTHEGFSEVLASVGLDYAYDHFTDGTEHELPFICFIYPERIDLKADNLNYQPIESVQVEFYSQERDFETEAEIAEALNDAGLVFTLDSAYLDDEGMYMTTFTTSYVLTEDTEEENTEGIINA